MPGEWKSVPLESLYDFSSGLSKPREEFGFGHGFLSFKDVFYNYFAPDKLGELVNSTEREQQTCSIARGDVFLTRTSETMDELGMSCVALKDYVGATFNGFTKRLRPKARDVIAPEYAGYYFRSPKFRRDVTSMSSLSTRASLNNEMLARLTIDVPPLEVQTAIGSILKALDDKIELNRRMNATLEAMARALFQSWFVDFDPVRAKLDGRKPVGFDAATAALFPEHLEDSPLGHIPKGWTAGTVVEGFKLTMGQSPPGDTYNEEGNGLPLYQGRTDFGFRFPTRRIYCSAPTRYAKPGDTLVSVRAPVGDINMANEECCIGRGVAAVRHKSGATSFTYHSIANLYPDFARFEAEGTVFGSINKDSFEKLRFVIPPMEIVAAYERQAGPLDEQIRILENQSRTLATLRDTLLPKLLSGELPVAAN
jgi:type I restriction enzyme, S subunit